MHTIKGRIFVLGDNVDTDQILPGYAMAEPFEELGKFAMAGAPEMQFQTRVRKGDILVAGRNFGCGSSREQAPISLKMAGVGLIVATAFARIFRRNAINIGLPVFVADIAEGLRDGDEIEVNLETGTIHIGARTLQAPPLSETSLKTLSCGGLINRVRKELGISQKSEQ